MRRLLPFAASVLTSAAAASQVPTLKYDVQPRVVSLKFVGSDPLHAIPTLRVIVTNKGNKAVEIALYCGTLPVRVVSEAGKATPSNSIGCPDILQTRLIQPGQTVKFDSFSFSNVKKLKPGHYVWIIGKEKFPFTLTK